MTAAPAAPTHHPIDWRGMFEKTVDFVLRWWLPILIVLALLFVASIARDIFAGPSGREVRAESNQRAAEVGQRQAESETLRARQSVVIVEDTHQRSRRAEIQTEEAREAVAAAPDLDASYAEYRLRAQRLRDEGGSAAAAAVRQHAAGDAP